MLEMTGRTSLSLLAQTQQVTRERRARVAAEALLETLGNLPPGLTIDGIMNRVSSHVLALLNCRRCRIFMAKPEEKRLFAIHKDASNAADATTLEALTAQGVSESFAARGLTPIEWGVGIAGLIAMSGEFVSTAAPSEHPSYVPEVDRGEAQDVGRHALLNLAPTVSLVAKVYNCFLF